MANFSSPSKPSSRRLLAVFAHPDDESFGPGGTLALYARRGDEVHLICATRGEVGDASARLGTTPYSVDEWKQMLVKAGTVPKAVEDWSGMG